MFANKPNRDKYDERINARIRFELKLKFQFEFGSKDSNMLTNYSCERLASY